MEKRLKTIGRPLVRKSGTLLSFALAQRQDIFSVLAPSVWSALRYNLAMILLSIDTCDARGSIALLQDGVLVRMVQHDEPLEYSSWLLPAVEALFRGGSLAMADVDAYAVAVGPGSFTGVRAGLTTVKAWSEVYRKAIAPVSRLEAVASQDHGEHSVIAAFLDASRAQIFGAVYECVGENLRLLGEESVMDPEKFVELAEERAAGRAIAWISTDPERIADTAQWKSAERPAIEKVSPFLAEAIGRIGHRKVVENKTVDSLTLDANYIRRPDAETFWKGLQAAKTP